MEKKKGWEKESIVSNEDSCELPDVYNSLIKIRIDKTKCFVFNTDEIFFMQSSLPVQGQVQISPDVRL